MRAERKDMNEYIEAEKEIRDAIIQISNKYEISKKDTVALLTYLIHDILSLREASDGSTLYENGETPFTPPPSVL